MITKGSEESIEHRWRKRECGWGERIRSTYVVEQVLIVDVEIEVTVAVPQPEQLPTGPIGLVSQEALTVTVDTDAAPVGHIGVGVIPQEDSVTIEAGSVTVDAGPVGHIGVTPHEVSVIVVSGAVGHEEGGAVGQTEVAGQLPVLTSVVVTIEVPAGGHEDGGAVGQTEVAGQLPVSTSVVVTVAVPAVGQVLGGQDPPALTVVVIVPAVGQVLGPEPWLVIVTGVQEVSGPTGQDVTRLVIVAVALEQVPTPPTVFDEAEVQSTHDEA